MSQYSALKLYKHAFKMTWDWRKWLPSDIYDYHSLVYRRQCSSRVTKWEFYFHLYPLYVDH